MQINKKGVGAVFKVCSRVRRWVFFSLASGFKKLVSPSIHHASQALEAKSPLGR